MVRAPLLQLCVTVHVSVVVLLVLIVRTHMPEFAVFFLPLNAKVTANNRSM